MGPDDLIPTQPLVSRLSTKTPYSFNLKPTKPGSISSSFRGKSFYMYKADLVVASIKGRVCVVKNRYSDPDETEIIDAVCKLLSFYVFENRFKLFVPAFEEDMKQAINGVIDKHHLKKWIRREIKNEL